MHVHISTTTSSPEVSTFLGYHRGLKKCRPLRELAHIPPPSLALHLWAVSNFCLALKIPYQILGLLTLSKLIFCWQIEFYIHICRQAQLSNIYSSLLSTSIHSKLQKYIYIVHIQYAYKLKNAQVQRCCSENTIIHRSYAQHFTD